MIIICARLFLFVRPFDSDGDHSTTSNVSSVSNKIVVQLDGIIKSIPP